MKKTLLTALLVAGLAVPGAATATTILFDDFEDGSAAEWTVVGRGGVYSPTATQYGVGVVDGTYVAFIRNTALMSVIPDYVIGDDSTLTLSVDVGWRNDNPDYGDFTIELLADGEVFASLFDSYLTQGAFTTLSLTYDTSAAEAAGLIGDELTIQFTHVGGYQVNFDNVTLTNDSNRVIAAVPEPATLLLLGGGLLGLGLSRRKWKL